MHGGKTELSGESDASITPSSYFAYQFWFKKHTAEKITILKDIWISYKMEWEHENKTAKKSQHKPNSCDTDNALRIIAVSWKKKSYNVCKNSASLVWFIPLRIYEDQEKNEELTLQEGNTLTLPGTGELQENIPVIWESAFTDYPSYTV